MIILILIVLGLCAGSFTNALVWRIKNKKNWVSERSICPSCKHVLAAKDLVPVLSWLELRGRCRYCHHKISVQYPLVEILVAGIFVASYVYWPYDLSNINVGSIALFTSWLLAVQIMVALALYDLKWMILPNKMVYTLVVVAAVNSCLVLYTGNANSILSILVGIAGTAGLFCALFYISDGKWMGGGDVKLMLALSLLAGSLYKAILVVFLASLLGSLVAIPIIIMGRAKRQLKIPFGPFLIAATLIVYLFGQNVIDWYLNSIVG